MSTTPSETDLRTEIEALKAELAALRKLLGVSATGSFTKETSLSPRFANLEIGPTGERPVIILGESDTGGSLIFFDKEGKILTFLASTEEGGILELCTTDYKQAIVAKAENGKGLFEVYGPEGTRRVGITSNENGGSVGVFAGPNSLRCLLTGAEGAGELAIWNQNNRQVVKFSTLNGGPMLTLLEPKSALPVAHFGYVPLEDVPNGSAIGASLILCDHTGQHSAELSAFNTGGNLRIFDQHKKTAIELDSSRVGSSLAFKNADGASLLAINSGKDGACISLNDGTGKGRIILSTLENDASVLLTTAEEEPAISITAKEPSNHSLHIFTAGKKHGASIFTTPKGGEVALFNGDDTCFIGLGHDRNLGPSLYCMDAETKQSRLTLCVGTDTSPGGLYFISPESTPIATLLAAPTGGQLRLFSELGIERASLHVIQDNSKLVLHTAGTGSICVAANEATTAVLTVDADGEITAHWPDEDE